MNYRSWLQHAEQLLKTAKILTARLDALVLLEDATGKDRAWLLAHPDTELSAKTINVLTDWMARRLQHEPLAYIRRKTEFYGREFIVSPAVLEPRPESETIIELLKVCIDHHSKHSLKTLVVDDQGSRLHQNDSLTIVDVGTGSGALAITAKLELPSATVFGLDIDPGCLAVATKNAQMHDVKITLLESDLLSALPFSIHVQPLALLCNLPYVPDDYAINQAATHEPKLALFGGHDGLEIYRKLFQQLNNWHSKPLLILTESLPEQHDILRHIAEMSDYQEMQRLGFIQSFCVEPA